MYVKLVQIGNSMGLRLPKSLIKQYHLDQGDIELKIEDNGIMIVPGKSKVAPRKDWDRLFNEAKASGFDPDQDATEFADWDVTLTDGIDD
jgi:antitoxin MazE